MKKYYLLLVSMPFFILWNACSPFKDNLIQSGDKNDAIKNAILDFSNTSRLYKKSTVFYVQVINLNKDKLGISISKSGVKILLTAKTKVGSKGYAPSQYIEKKGKLFFWRDDNYPLSEDALNIFTKYKITQSDEGGLIVFPDHEIDDSQKGVHYYFCRNNLLNYKKVTTNIGMGYYDPPRLNCR
jgi:hypothetical protein